jgi:hypothetical protein
MSDNLRVSSDKHANCKIWRGTIKLLELFFVVDGPDERKAVAVGEKRGDGAPDLR